MKWFCLYFRLCPCSLIAWWLLGVRFWSQWHWGESSKFCLLMLCLKSQIWCRMLIFWYEQILPQSICSHYGLAIGASVAPLVRVLVWICFPIAYPISKVINIWTNWSCYLCLTYSPIYMGSNSVLPVVATRLCTGSWSNSSLPQSWAKNTCHSARKWGMLTISSSK